MLGQHVDPFIIVIPRRADLAAQNVPVVCQDLEGARICLLPQPVDSKQCLRYMLSETEISAGMQLLCQGKPVHEGDQLHICPGLLFTRQPPWVSQKRKLGYVQPSAAGTHHDVPASIRSPTQARSCVSYMPLCGTEYSAGPTRRDLASPSFQTRDFVAPMVARTYGPR